jgi:hypothetical protein
LRALHGGGPRDPEKRQQLLENGWKPYSWQIGNTYISYVNTPMALAMGMIGSATDPARYGELDKKQWLKTNPNRKPEEYKDNASYLDSLAWVLFKQKKYKEAAAADYAVLSAGPPWNWDTMRDLYPDVNVYTAQLRGLEDYIKQNPQSADAMFLASYHYLVGGHADTARKGFEAEWTCSLTLLCRYATPSYWTPQHSVARPDVCAARGALAARHRCITSGGLRDTGMRAHWTSRWQPRFRHKGSELAYLGGDRSDDGGAILRRCYRGEPEREASNYGRVWGIVSDLCWRAASKLEFGSGRSVFFCLERARFVLASYQDAARRYHR